jgi:phage terminase small subunit
MRVFTAPSLYETESMECVINLTIKQDNFYLSYIETGNASEAYRRSFNSAKMKPETINRAAKEIMDTPPRAPEESTSYETPSLPPPNSPWVII